MLEERKEGYLSSCRSYVLYPRLDALALRLDSELAAEPSTHLCMEGDHYVTQVLPRYTPPKNI